MESQHTCSRCGEPIPPSPWQHTTGYALDGDGNKVCYDCCAKEDRDFMVKEGKIMLYLTDIQTFPPTQTLGTMGRHTTRTGKISNWPGSLKWENVSVKKGRHNWGIPRYDTWFVGPDENGVDRAYWHGVQYGDNTQIVHCKRTKQRTA